ncbi:MAG: thiamine pyrophosphate-dependent dehydrogenase E1 component subunit alpha [Pseudomonadota bacterium]
MSKLTNEQQLTLYRGLVLARKYDELNVRMASEGKLLTFYHSAQGHEAIGIGACSVLNKSDYLYMHIRGHGIAYAIGKGVDPKPCVAEHLGKATGWGGGITGVHMVDKENGMLGVGGTIGSAFVLSAGYALAAKKRGKGQVCFCFTGDGGMQRGQAHEAMNMAACWKLPVVWIVENNQMAWFTPFCDTCALENIADMAKSYNMPGEIVDGMDVFAVREAAEKAVDRARKGKGPTLIECKTYRFRAHSEGRPDVCHYKERPKDEIEKWKKRDPLALCRNKLLEKGILTEELISRIDEECNVKTADAEKFALESPYPDPAILKQLVYAP